MLEEASSTLAGLSRCAGLVVSPKSEAALKHIEFVPLGNQRALVVMVTEGGLVENRIVELPPGLPPSVLPEASNYLNARLKGQMLEELRRQVEPDIAQRRAGIGRAAGREGGGETGEIAGGR